MWTLLEKDDRSERESGSDGRCRARLSVLLGGRSASPSTTLRGEWQISRVYATVARAEPALYHARRCLEICEKHRIGGFDLAYAHEALARAHDLAGDRDLAADNARRAHASAQSVTDDEDRELLLSDLASLPR